MSKSVSNKFSYLLLDVDQGAIRAYRQRGRDRDSPETS